MAYGTFNHGGATYPLTADLSGSLLRDADPALYYALAFFEAVITRHLSDRLLAQAAQAGVTEIRKAVAVKVPYDPRPWLQETQLPSFPLLAVHRVASRYGVASSSYMRNEATWMVSYTLPSLTAAQFEQIGPILHAIESVLLNRIENTFDPAYRNGASVWALAGIEEITLESASFGTFITTSNIMLPTWVGTLKVRERDMPAPDAAFDGNFAGLDAFITSQSGEEPPVDVVSLRVDDASVAVEAISSLVAMHVAEDVVTDSTGSLVESWPSAVAGGNAMTPLAPGNRPVHALDGDTRVEMVAGDGVTAELMASVPSLVADTGKTLVVAFRLWDTERRSSLALITSTVANGTFALEANPPASAGNRIGLFVMGSSFDTQFVTDTEWHIAAVRISASSGSIAATTRVQIDDQPAVLSLRSGSGTWGTFALSPNLGVLGLSSDLLSTAACGSVGVVLAFDSELSDADTATAVAFCKQWLRSAQQ